MIGVLNKLGLVLFVASDVLSERQPAVTTPLGEIAGYYMRTRGGRDIAAFTGIPYAVPPLGDLRFKAPVPISPWKNTLDGTKQSPLCVQRNPYIRQERIVGQEDCLYLNIYTPVVDNELSNEGKPLPVMLFIHGGGWMCGDATTGMYGPEYLLDRDVILVTTNYRLGPLGFLSTLDEHCPGNNGLKDQQEALRFIQKVIESFGGDKKSVTIFGESAGGASAHFHMISKSSAGLFHKAISESGTAVVPWAEASPGEALRNTFRLAKFLECPQTPSEKMIACLRTKDSYDIINTEFKFYEWDYEPMTPFKAVVEPNLPGAFLTQSPRKVSDVPAVPWMNGVNKDEGCLKSVCNSVYAAHAETALKRQDFVDQLDRITNNSTRYQEFVSGFDSIAPVTFYYESSPFVNLITKKIREHYFKRDDHQAMTRQILELYSDSYFAYPALEATELLFNYTKNAVYLYELTYRASNSFSQIFGDPEGDYGVCHADELMHLFPIHFLSQPVSEQDLKMSETIVTLWTNFATTGNPTKPVKVPFTWTPATSSQKMEYLDLSSEPKMKHNLVSQARFWATLPIWHKVKNNKFIDEL